MKRHSTPSPGPPKWNTWNCGLVRVEQQACTTSTHGLSLDSEATCGCGAGVAGGADVGWAADGRCLCCTERGEGWGGAAPLRDVIRRRPTRAREFPRSEESGPATALVVENRECMGAFVHRASECRPARAVPLRNLVHRSPARDREVSCGMESGPATALVVEDREVRKDGGAYCASDCGPARTVPLRNSARSNPSRARETPSGVESAYAAAVVEDREGGGGPAWRVRPPG